MTVLGVATPSHALAARGVCKGARCCCSSCSAMARNRIGFLLATCTCTVALQLPSPPSLRLLTEVQFQLAQLAVGAPGSANSV